MRLVTASALLIAVPAMAATYTDPAGDIATGNPNLDIVSVDVSHTVSDVVISMKLDDLNGDWGSMDSSLISSSVEPATMTTHGAATSLASKA